MARVNTESVIAQDTWTHSLFSTSGDRAQLLSSPRILPPAGTLGRWRSTAPGRDEHSRLSQPPPGGSHDVRAAFNAAFLRRR